MAGEILCSMFSAVARLLLLSLLTPAQVLGTELPTYAQLKSHIPITLTPGGEDQYLFFVVPVMRLQEQEQQQPLVVQMAQAQDHPDAHHNHTIHAIVGDANHGNHSQPQSLKDVFWEAANPAGGVGFNFQVPVVVPLDLHFTYSQDTTPLLQCSLDTRTWRERVISRVASQMDLQGGREWEHSQQAEQIRLFKDALAAITLTHLTNQDALTTLLEAIIQCKNMTDTEYGFLLENPDTVLSQRLQSVAEGLDTYTLMESRLGLALTAAETLGATDTTTLVESLLPGVREAMLLLTHLLATLKEHS